MLDPRAFLINNRTGRVVAATFIEFLNGTTTEPSVCFTNSPDSGLSCDSAGAVHYVKNGTDLGELGTATNLIGGSNTQIQYNDNGSFGGSADLTWDDSAKELGVGGDINLDDGGTYETTVQVVTPTANRTISFPDATGTVALVAGSTGQAIYNNAGALAGFNGLTIDGSGNLSGGGVGTTSPAVAWDVVGQVRASTGILFGTDTAAANALDDYEEGSWTPAYAFSTSGSVTQAFTVGKYTKTGNVVVASARIATSAISSPTGNATITGLPFTTSSVTHLRSAGAIGQSSGFGSNLPLKLEIDHNGSVVIEIKKNATDAGGANLQGSDFAAGSPGNLLDFSIVYYTS